MDNQDVWARDYDDELDARDFDDEFEARDFDDEFEARDFMDLEDELEMREPFVSGFWASSVEFSLTVLILGL